VRITIGTPPANGYLVSCLEQILHKQTAQRAQPFRK